MQLPVYTHPTLTVLIDDSDSFLKSMAFQLDPALARKTFHDTSTDGTAKRCAWPLMRQMRSISMATL